MRCVRSLVTALLLLSLSVCCAVPASAEPEMVYCRPCAREKKLIALTFDDGPHPRYTPQILDILAEYDVKATFFTIGINAETYPELIRRARAEGHEIGNHTYSHYNASKLSDEALQKEIASCDTVLRHITDTPVRYFRPPEGVCSAAAKRICEQYGYTIVMWSVDTRDWAHTPVNDICRNVMKNTKNGSVILMHDFIGKNSPTPAALRQIIPMLQKSGFTFVTVSQLLEG